MTGAVTVLLYTPVSHRTSTRDPRIESSGVFTLTLNRAAALLYDKLRSRA
jgi:hypothetical protein